MKKQRDFLRGMADRMDLPGEPVPGKPALELLGKNRVIIENHRGILDYSREEIRVRVSYGWIHITGSGLELSLMSGQQLIITGTIGSILLGGDGPC